MVKEITIDGKKVKLKATASTAARYRRFFGRDLIVDFKAIQEDQKNGTVTLEDCDRLQDLAYVLAWQAAKDDPEITIPDDPLDWLDTFEVFPMNEIFPIVMSLWMESMGTIAEPKKK